MEHKGFGSLFDDKFLPEQIAWAEIFLIEQTRKNWPEEYQAGRGLFTLGPGSWGVIFGRKSQADQLPDGVVWEAVRGVGSEGHGIESYLYHFPAV